MMKRLAVPVITMFGHAAEKHAMWQGIRLSCRKHLYAASPVVGTEGRWP